jgi:hypothetical protein
VSQDVAKAGGGQHRGPAALSLDDGVRRQGGGVDQPRDPAGGDRLLREHLGDPFQHRPLGLLRRGQHLGRLDLPRAAHEDHVGEGAADVDAELEPIA